MRTYKELQSKDWLIEQAKTKRQHEIASDVGCSRSAIIRAYKKHGIKFQRKNGRGDAATYIFYPKLQDREWLELQIKTMTMREIAEEIGCSGNAVSYAVHEKYGLSMPLHTGRPQPSIHKYPQLHNEGWLRERIAERSIHAIAKEVGCSYGGVINVIRKFGIDVPSRTKPSAFREPVRQEKARRSKGGFGADAPHWKGGKIDCASSRYVSTYSPGHQRADIRGYVLEHLLVMEEKIGRPIESSERVHHINNNGKDNRPENLELYSSNKAHFQRHFNAVAREQLLELEISRLRKILDEKGIAY